MQSKLSDGSVLVSGTVTKDAEYKLVGDKGTPITKFSITAGKRKDTTTIFVNCVAWKKLAASLANLQKGDSFFGVGTVKTREYNGKEYSDLELEFGISPNLTPKVDGGSFDKLDTLTEKLGGAGVDFVEINDPDGELPF